MNKFGNSISKDIIRFLKNSEIKEYIDNNDYKELYAHARAGFELTFNEIAEMWRFFQSAGINWPEPIESKMLNFIGKKGTLNSNVKFRAKGEVSGEFAEEYRKLVPYIGKEVEIIRLSEADIFDEGSNIYDNFTQCFWEIEVKGLNYQAIVCGDCIDFPQLEIKQKIYI